MVKIAIYVIAFYLIYILLLRRDKAHGRNRAFIIISLIASIILPSFTINTVKPVEIQTFGKLLSEVFVSSGADAGNIKNQGTEGIIYSAYVTGVIIFLFKLIADFSGLLFLIIRKKKSGNRVIRFQDFDTTGFSAMGFIFINTRLNPEEAGNVIRHERNHLDRNHYVDIIFIEFMTAFQWFNPFIYLFNRELRAVHEFQADQGCISSGIPVTSYQNLLLNQVFRTGSFKLTNSFSNPSLIRKRMIMMTRQSTSRIANFKLLSVLPVAGLVFLSLSVDQLPVKPQSVSPVTARTLTQPEEEIPFVVVEEMPYFPGGDGALLQYISENVVYPEEAYMRNIQGRVIVRFCITPHGGISQVSVIKSVDPNLDAEAMRVVSTLPRFEPGKQGGRPVPVWYMVPITFTVN